MNASFEIKKINAVWFILFRSIFTSGEYNEVEESLEKCTGLYDEYENCLN